MQNDQPGNCSRADRLASQTKYRKITQMKNMLDFVAHQNADYQAEG